MVHDAAGTAGRADAVNARLEAFAAWLDGHGEAEAATRARAYGEASALGYETLLPGPVGERNVYALHPRGRILLSPATRAGLFEQMAAVLATGNRARIEGMALPADLPAEVAAVFADSAEPVSAALVEGDAARVAQLVQAVAALPGPIVSVHAADAGQRLAYPCDWLLEEVVTSINTTAAGGNASLMMIG